MKPAHKFEQAFYDVLSYCPDLKCLKQTLPPLFVSLQLNYPHLAFSQMFEEGDAIRGDWMIYTSHHLTSPLQRKTVSVLCVLDQQK